MKCRAVFLLCAALCMAFSLPPLALPASDAIAHRDNFVRLCEKGEAEAVRQFLQGDGVNLLAIDKAHGLISAVTFGHVGVIETMLAAGVDANAKGYVGDRALMAAARKGDAGLVKLLLAAGADVNAGDDNGKTPLMRAAGYPEIVKLLLAAGADVNAQTSSGMYPGWTALMEATSTPEVLKLLLSAGADVNARASDGRTPLIVAAMYGWPKSVKLLLARGADAQAQDEEGHNALWHVRNPTVGIPEADAAEVIRLLEQAGTK